MTRYFAVRLAEITPGATAPPHPSDWKPWTKCHPEDMDRMVVHRLVRDMGGVRERQPVQLFETVPAGAPPDQAASARFVQFILHPD